MLLRSDCEALRKDSKSTDRHRPRPGVASEQHLAFPFGIARGELGRRWQLGEQGREQQQIPDILLAM